VAEFPPTAESVRDAGIECLRAGWSVIPIVPLDKKPLIAWEPYQWRPAEEDEWAEWCDKWPDLNMAVLTGKLSGLVVVDIDGERGKQSLTAAGAELPQSLLAKTPHGWHAIFDYPNNGTDAVRNRANLLPGVDIRGDGGYIVIAPSRLADGGYEWLRRVDLEPFPSWVLDLSLVEPRNDDDRPDWVRAALEEGQSRGSRNDMAARMAGYFHSCGLPADVIRQILEPYRSACSPPMDARELQRTVDSVCRYRTQADKAGVQNPPTLRRTALGFRYCWDALGVSIDLQYISAERGAMFAELMVLSELPGTPKRLHGPVRFNMMNTGSRERIAQFLSRRLPLDWTEVLEQTCRLEVERYRAGEPAMKLREAVKPTGGQFAIPPLILADGPTIWFADGGVGKSIMALAAALALSRGDEYLLGIAPAQQLRVLYLDWEWDAWQHLERMEAILGSESSECDMLYRHCVGALVQQVESIRRVIVEESVDFVVIDSVGAACAEEPESARVALDFANAVRELGVGSLWLAHTTKNGDKMRPFGSTFWHNVARATWYLDKQQDGGGADLALGFFHRKSNSGRLERPLGFGLTWEADRVFIERIDVAAVPSLAQALPARDRILALLGQGALTADEVAEELDMPKSTTKARLSELKRAGKVYGLPGHRWGLASLGTEVPA